MLKGVKSVFYRNDKYFCGFLYILKIFISLIEKLQFRKI